MSDKGQEENMTNEFGTIRSEQMWLTGKYQLDYYLRMKNEVNSHRKLGQLV